MITILTHITNSFYFVIIKLYKIKLYLYYTHAYTSTHITFNIYIEILRIQRMHEL